MQRAPRVHDVVQWCQDVKFIWKSGMSSDVKISFLNTFEVKSTFLLTLLQEMNAVLCCVANASSEVAMYTQSQSANDRRVTVRGWLCWGSSYRSLLHANVARSVRATEAWCTACRKLMSQFSWLPAPIWCLGEKTICHSCWMKRKAFKNETVSARDL